MTITIEVPPQDQQRMAKAFGEMLGLTGQGGQPRPATDPEITAETHTWLNQQTQDYERRQNQKAFVPPPLTDPGAPIAGGKPAPLRKK